MTIADLACSINSCLPSIEQIKAHNLRVEGRMKERALKVTSAEHDLEQIEKSRNQMTFTYDIDRETDVMVEKLCQLIERTNIQWRPGGFQWNPPGALNFYNEIRKSTFMHLNKVEKGDILLLDRRYQARYIFSILQSTGAILSFE